MIPGLIVITAVLCLCFIIAGVAEILDLRRRLTALERKESKRVEAGRLQKIRDRRKR